jgi:hypothetical protein
LILLNLAGAAHGAVILDADWTVNMAVPDGNPVGITTSQSFPNLFNGRITSVSVDLNISGGYNGDLYGYLVYQDANGGTATETLLNRVGTSPANPFGSSGSGFSSITLSDSGTLNGSIHNAPGVPTGTWQPDSTATLSSTFGGLAADGTWTLFLADLSVGGGTSELDSWGLEITAVPEPRVTGTFLGLVALLAVAFELRHRTKRQKLQVALD